MASSSVLLSKELGPHASLSSSVRPIVEADALGWQPRSPAPFISRVSARLRNSAYPSSRSFTGSNKGLKMKPAGIPMRRLAVQATAETEGMTDAEKEGWEKRMEESKEAGTDNSSFGEWKWTLNWDLITPDIAVGSCPRSAADVDRLINEGGFDAILNLQSDLCFDALKIPIDDIRSRAISRGVLLRRVPVRDFDHNDQALMLPEAVRALNSLVSQGKKVYVHCTAGINRATLTTVGYLTFVRGLALEEAVTVVRTARPVAHPYIDCWQTVRHRFLEGREEQLTTMSKEIYDGRCAIGAHGNMSTDWRDAQTQLIAQTFQRYLEVDRLAYELERDIAAGGAANPEPATSAAVVEGSDANGASHSEVLEDEEEADDADALECNVVTRECVKADAAEVDEWDSSLAPAAQDQEATGAGQVK